MARPLRIEFDGAIYHVTARGNARKAIYKEDDDRKDFLEILHGINKRFNWICHAYCLMNNHYHLIIETPDGNLSKGMRQLNGVYTQLYNRRHHRVGHVFQGRYKAVLIEKESYLLEVSRYVVLNPVRAKAAERPEDWSWSSYRGTAGIEKPLQCLTTDWLLGQFASKKRQAESKYREFVQAGVDEKGIWGKVKGQSILGEDAFVERMMRHVKGREDVKEIPRSQRYVGRPALPQLVDGAFIKDRKKSAAAIRSAIFDYGYTLKEVADFLEIHYSTVSRMISSTDFARNTMQGIIMNKTDESELHRLTNLLSEINNKAELTADQKKALKKAALALSVSFIHGHRKEIEEIYQGLDEPLTTEQKQHLRSLGIKNDENE